MLSRKYCILGVLALLGVVLSYGLSRLDERSPAGQAGMPPAPATQDADKPKRIISASPAITEILYTLGQGDAVAGISAHTVYPEDALRKPSIGGVLNPNRERILSLEPDLVLLQGENRPLRDFCTQHSIRHLGVDLTRMDDIFDAIRVIGETTRDETDARLLIDSIQAEFDTIRKRVADRPRRTVFLSCFRPAGRMSGLLTPGPETFLGKLVEIAGGKNAFSDLDENWPQVSKEALIKRDIEVIIECSTEPIATETREKLLGDWATLPSLPAVKNGRIDFVQGDHVLIPGPRIILTARAFARAIHPEVFDD